LYTAWFSSDRKKRKLFHGFLDYGIYGYLIADYIFRIKKADFFQKTIWLLRHIDSNMPYCTVMIEIPEIFQEFTGYQLSGRAKDKFYLCEKMKEEIF
jgi:hypothetical protein